MGKALGGLLRPGHLVLLEGPLGAGKTVFVQGIGEGMGLEERVTSPTFTLVHHYGFQGGQLLVHADLYRLEDPGEVEHLGLDDGLADGPLVVEWWRRAQGAFPPGRLEVDMVPEGPSVRQLRCRATDAWHAQLLAAWRARWEGGAHADFGH